MMTAPVLQASSGTDALLQRSYQAFETWIFDDALPFWAGPGQDAPGLGFIEHLTLDGRPALVSHKRVRVQARQIYVYANAALLGVPHALSAAGNGYDFLTSHGWNAGGGFAHSLGRYGGVHDPAVDLYENAFALLAMAWYARASGRREPIDWAHRTLDWIEAHMRTPQDEGFENALPLRLGPRLQNPHMHLLEACLALHETTGENRFAATARDLLDLFGRRLFDPHTGSLAEFYTPDWGPLGAPAERRIEPGHLFEWVWLLEAAHRQLGVTAYLAPMQAIYDFSVKNGPCAQQGWIIDATNSEGMAIERSGRLWPQTEAIKAHMAMWRRGNEEAALQAAQLTDLLLERFLSGAPRGTWQDHLAADGTLKSDRIPASSFYHIFMAFNELRQALRGRDTG